MRFPLPHITTLVLLVHMGFGCCWHHEHSSAVACDGGHHALGVPSHDDHDQSHDDTFHADHADHHSPAHSPHEPDRPCSNDCDDSHCVFLRIDQALDLQGGTSVGSASCAAVTPCDHLPSHALAGHVLDAWQRVQGTGLRAHLTFQVLLI